MVGVHWSRWKPMTKKDKEKFIELDKKMQQHRNKSMLKLIERINNEGFLKRIINLFW